MGQMNSTGSPDGQKLLVIPRWPYNLSVLMLLMLVAEAFMPDLTLKSAVITLANVFIWNMFITIKLVKKVELMSELIQRFEDTKK